MLIRGLVPTTLKPRSARISCVLIPENEKRHVETRSIFLRFARLSVRFVPPSRE